MPAFLAALLGGLVAAAGSLVGRVLIALGISYVTYTGVSTALSAIQSQVQGNLTGLPVMLLQVAYLLKIDVFISIMFSAITARLTIKGLTAGAITKAKIS